MTAPGEGAGMPGIYILTPYDCEYRDVTGHCYHSDFDYISRPFCECVCKELNDLRYQCPRGMVL